MISKLSVKVFFLLHGGGVSFSTPAYFHILKWQVTAIGRYMPVTCKKGICSGILQPSFPQSADVSFYIRESMILLEIYPKLKGIKIMYVYCIKPTGTKHFSVCNSLNVGIKHNFLMNKNCIYLERFSLISVGNCSILIVNISEKKSETYKLYGR
jgi:hypothetical protein